MLTQAAGQWWFDMGGGWYDDTLTMTAVERINDIAAAALLADRLTALRFAPHYLGAIRSRELPSPNC